MGVFGPPLTNAALCAAWSWFVQVTVSPALIVTVGGSKAKFAMSTLAFAPAAVEASAMNRRRHARAASLVALSLIAGGAGCRRAPADTGPGRRGRRSRRPGRRG